MLTERVATKAMPVLSFTTDCGDALCLVDMVGDLLDKDDLVVATAVQPAAAPVPLLVVAETSGDADELAATQQALADSEAAAQAAAVVAAQQQRLARLAPGVQATNDALAAVGAAVAATQAAIAAQAAVANSRAIAAIANSRAKRRGKGVKRCS